MTKRTLFTSLAFVPVFFLIFLGMRNPALEHNPGPKQRPRAVVEERGAKAEVAKSYDHQVAVELAPLVVIVSSPVTISQRLAVVPRQAAATPPASHPSRASPSLVSAIS